ncbi:MAG: helicase-related protein [Dongiaceae bacterium]
MIAAPEGRVTAVLGPTNTGKTYLAVERMLGHRSGMIGFPLRLLARENYDRIVKLKGPNAVALVTGEERIIPAHPSYFVCTVESMPVDRRVAFLAIDEVQLAADPERGHVFTDRLLRARGEDETMLLGAETIRPLLRKLIPGAEFISRPRFSTLSYAGPKKPTRLPRRSAVVAFSAADVYALAELMRRQRGGCAVVMGALSPRTRNAQVGMYQAGEVDYLVATDAIGMGLNMDLDHVAFARLSKFDGRSPRRLNAPEIAQIAGRAGRHMNDGSFGTTAEAGQLEPELVEAIEQHRFDALTALYWRNADLDFRSIDGLRRSLDRAPPGPGLVRAREADDQMALSALAREPEIADLARSRSNLQLLWEVCQIPDFSKTMADAHTRLLSRVFRSLASSTNATLPIDWVANQIARIDRIEGDIDTLVQRIAQVRTWTYISNRDDWLSDARQWQERTRMVEDRLSDALHHSLTQRFVDRRHALLSRQLKGNGHLASTVTVDGDVIVEGHSIGRLDGFSFMPDNAATAEAARSLMASARRALILELPRRLRLLESADDAELALSSDGQMQWRGAMIARLAAGDDPLSPRIELLAGEIEDGRSRERMRRRLCRWLDAMLKGRLRLLFEARNAALNGSARGMVYQLVWALGTLPRRQVAPQIAGLTKADRHKLAGLGIRIGRESVWFPQLTKTSVADLTRLLWATYHGRLMTKPITHRPVCLALERGLPDEFYLAIGYRRIDRMAVRVDALERFSTEAHKLARQGPFAPTEKLRGQISCPLDRLAPVLSEIGFRRDLDSNEATFLPRARRGQPMTAGTRDRPAKGERRSRARSIRKPNSNSPFAGLSGLRFGK